ncbi:hypothetical protein QUA79_17755 [Microcoleus sp. F8-D1]
MAGKTRPYERIPKLYILIYLWVGAGLGNYLFEAMIVGETRPYDLWNLIFLHCGYL